MAENCANFNQHENNAVKWKEVEGHHDKLTAWKVQD
jgi:hypothetical protein